MGYDVKLQTLVDLIKEEGEEQAAVDLKQGRYNRRYRKNRNIRQSAILELAKTDPRFKAAMDAATAKATKK